MAKNIIQPLNSATFVAKAKNQKIVKKASGTKEKGKDLRAK